MATADQSRVWFTLDAEAKPVGPYTVEELVGYATSGYVSEAQVFWKDGNAGWQKAAEIADLAAVAQALQQYRQQHPNSNPAGSSSSSGQQNQQQQQQHHPSHAKVISAKASDPLDAFKQQIQAVEQQGEADDDDPPAAAAAAGGAVDGAAAAVDDGVDWAGTPDELEFEDDDGTIYKWDRQLRKYMPAGEAAAAADGDGDGQQQQQQSAAGYDVEAMTFVAEEEVIPTLAAVRAAEEAAVAAGGKSRKRAGDADEDGQQQQQGKKAKPSDPAAAAEAAPAAAAGGGDAAAAQAGSKQEEEQPQGWFELKNNTNVYVTGLPDDTDVDEVAGVFAKCGIIKMDDAGQPRIKLYRDKASGLLKGDGLVTYLKAPSVQLACQILDGTPLRATGGPNMKVTPAKFEMKGRQYQDKKGAEQQQQQQKKKKKGGGGGGRGGGGGGRGGGGRGRRGPLGVQEKLERKLGWGGFDDLLPPEKVTVVLKHLFTPDEAAEGGASFATELEADVTAECKKWGTVEKVRVFPLHPEGVVTVRFKQAEPAEACVSVMNGRFFGGNKLVAHMWDGFTQYHGVKVVRHETAEEEAARLEAFARELEAKQQQQQAQQQHEAAAAAATAAGAAESVGD